MIAVNVLSKKNIVKTLLHKNDKYHFINLYFILQNKNHFPQ